MMSKSRACIVVATFLLMTLPVAGTNRASAQLPGFQMGGPFGFPQAGQWNGGGMYAGGSGSSSRYNRYANRYGYGSRYGQGVSVSPEVAQAANDAAAAQFRAAERGYRLMDQQIGVQEIKVYETRLKEMASLHKLKAELQTAGLADYERAKNAEVRDDHLNSREWNRVTGAVKWPVGLRAASFSADRQALAELLARQQSVHEEPNLASEVHRTVANMLSRLKQDIHTMTPSEYTAARHFLNRLDNENQTPPGRLTEHRASVTPP